MRNVNPTSPSQFNSRMLAWMLALSMVAVAAPAVSHCLEQVFVPAIRKVQTVERQSSDAIRFSRRLYRFYRLATEQAAAVQGAN